MIKQNRNDKFVFVTWVGQYKATLGHESCTCGNYRQGRPCEHVNEARRRYLRAVG